MPSCAVIIVTHNSQRYIHKAIGALDSQTLQPNHVVIVDSGSSEPSYLLPYKKRKNTSLILSPSNIGFCQGNNLGFRSAKSSEYVFFLNPDVFLTPTFLEEGIDFLEKPSNQQCGALTGTLLSYDINQDKPTGKYDSTGIFRTWYGKWYDRNQGKEVVPHQFQTPETIPAICGALFLCRREALQDQPVVFDPSFFAYKEDIDLSYRLRKAGWQLSFLPHLKAYHCRGWKNDRSQIPRRLRLLSARNEIRIQWRHKALIPLLYSLAKYIAVFLFDV